MSATKQFVYGFHAVQALLEQGPDKVQHIYVQSGKQDQRLQNLLQRLEKFPIPVDILSRHELNQMVNDEQHQGIVALSAETSPVLETDLEALLANLTSPAFLLILDGVQDPHNLGACLRTANAAGVHAVIAPKDRATGITAVVRKVASGAAESTPFIQVTNLARTMRMLKEAGVWLFGASEDAEEDVFTTDFRGAIAIVLGAEGSGLRRLTRENCDKVMKIPTVGVISSLNVSVATGVCLFEALRQRMQGR